MRFVHPDQAKREILSEENKKFTRENFHIFGREPTLDELERNYKQHNIICKVVSYHIEQQINASRF